MALVGQQWIRNPVFVLDEIDKIADTSISGAPSAALLELLDADQNDAFRDNYLGLPFDMSEVFFIATANVPDLIPAPLRDRLEVIALPGYKDDEKMEIAMQHILPRQLTEHGLRANTDVRFDGAAVLTIIQRYTEEVGVRGLNRRIGAICAKAAVRLQENAAAGPLRITPQTVRDFLGEPVHEVQEAGIEVLRARVERTLIGPTLSEAHAAAVREVERLTLRVGAKITS